MRLRLGSFARLLKSPRLWALACHGPWMFAGETLHRAGLHALAAGHWGVADRLFEGAAEGYRDGLLTEPLARVRVHQLMARAVGAGGRVSPLSLEVDRALTRLDWIESPVPPFALVPAHALLASWLGDPEVEARAERLAA